MPSSYQALLYTPSSPSLFDDDPEVNDRLETSDFLLDQQHHWMSAFPSASTTRTTPHHEEEMQELHHDEDSLFNDDDLMIVSNNNNNYNNHHIMTTHQYNNFNDTYASMDHTQHSLANDSTNVAFLSASTHWQRNLPYVAPVEALVSNQQTHSQHVVPPEDDVSSSSKYWNMAEEEDGEWLNTSETLIQSDSNTWKDLLNNGHNNNTHSESSTPYSNLVIRKNIFVARPFTELIIEEGEISDMVAAKGSKNSNSNSQVSSHLNITMEEEPAVPEETTDSGDHLHAVTESTKQSQETTDDSSTDEEEDPDYIEEEEMEEKNQTRKTRQSIKRKRTIVCDSTDEEESQEMQASTSSSMLTKPSKKEKKLRKKKTSNNEKAKLEKDEKPLRTMSGKIAERFSSSNHGTISEALTVVPNEFNDITAPHLRVDLDMPCSDMYVKPAIFVKNGVTKKDDSRSSIFTVNVSLQWSSETLKSKVKLENLRLLIVSDKQTKKIDGEKLNVMMIKNSNLSTYALKLSYLAKDPNDKDLLSIVQIEEYQDKYVFKCQVSTSNNASGWKNKHNDYKVLVFDTSDSGVFGGISQGFKVAKAPKSQSKQQDHDSNSFDLSQDCADCLSNVFIQQGKKKRKLQISKPTIVKHSGKLYKITVQEISKP
ncbi:hypothetical protein FDP41_003575 [Naegleria fowleri]|uniref:Uncharacterized protein n=1 Tax=Naegleria fowleri TaxID=5763 RepID=A0A6A5BI82_NAEFO|nr:uncharacterized protein FDP41_003575 [Naegleria fowleri]KAF0977583.1 hypothetical protein FDP41_003575 [Naegleria fowleri]CAG4711915.1 unnamed protein product [Naegleria fowleri]